MSKPKRETWIMFSVNGALDRFRVIEELHHEPPEATSFLTECPSCKQRMIPVFDTQQMGFWQDSYKTYFACRDCRTAIVYVYELSRIEPVATKRQKKPTR